MTSLRGCCHLLWIVLLNPWANAETPPPVRLVTLDWPPYVGQTLPAQGYASEVMQRAFAASGQTVEIRFAPWARALRMVRNGEVDGLFPEYYDPQQRPSLSFSQAFPGGPVGLYARKDSHFTLVHNPQTDPSAAVAELKGKTLGLVRGYINHPTLDASELFQRDLAVSDEQNLAKLFRGGVDLIFIDFFVARYWIARRYPWFAEELVAIEPAFENKTLHLVTMKDQARGQAVLKSFDQGLQKLKDSGELDNIVLSHGLR